MAAAKRVLILGGGVIGLCSAWHAARRGHRVTVIERGGPDHDSCAVGSAGMITPSHFIPLAAPGAVALGLKWMWNPESPFYIQPRLSWDLLDWAWRFWRAANAAQVARAAPLLRDLHLASRAGFEELAALPGNDFGLVKQGLLMLCKTQHALDEEAHTAGRARALGIPAEVLTAKETAALDPHARLDILGAVFFPKDCHLSPARFLAGLKTQLDSLGVEFLWNAEATGFTHHPSRLTSVHTAQGEIPADEFVLAGGAWSPLLARGLGLRLPMQAGKGYSLTLDKPRQLPQLCSILTEARVAVTPMGGALRFGGTMEIAGLNEDINPVRVRGILKAVPRYFPDFTPEDFNGVTPWRGLRPCTPDGLPYLGRTARWPNLIVAAGHAMLGLSLGPVTGRLVGELLSGEKPSFDLRLLAPERHG
jgi:D-amino-acid dehydrogenase